MSNSFIEKKFPSFFPKAEIKGRVLYKIDDARLISDPVAFLTSAREEFGTPFYLQIPQNKNIYFYDDPELIRQIMLDTTGVYSAGKNNANALEPIVGKGSILVMDGAPHLRERRMLLPYFRGERMAAYAQVTQEATRTESTKWEDGQEVEALRVGQKIALAIIIRAVFGISGELHDSFKYRLIKLMRRATNPTLYINATRVDVGPWSPLARFERSRQRVDDFLYEEIARRRQSGERGDDIMSLLLDATYEDGAPIEESGIRDELVTMLTAGHETTAAATAWCLDRFATHQDWQYRVREEIEAIDEATPEAVTAESAPWLNCFIEETLRLRPPISLCGRLTEEEVSVGGITIPQDTIIGFCGILTHHNEKYWPEPHLFMPDRFYKKKPEPYSYIPFGGGVRRCLGMAFAMHELRIILSQLLRDYAFSKESPYPAKARRPFVTLIPQKGAPLTVTKRR